MIKSLSKEIIQDFNEKEKNFNNNYNKNINKSPNYNGIEYIDSDQKKKHLLYFYNFEIISKHLYNYLFKSLNLIINLDQIDNNML